MKYTLLQDHKVRLTDTILIAGEYTIEQLKEAHPDDSFEFCMKYTTLKEKLILIEDNIIENIQFKKNKTK